MYVLENQTSNCLIEVQQRQTISNPIYRVSTQFDRDRRFGDINLKIARDEKVKVDINKG